MSRELMQEEVEFIPTRASLLSRLKDREDEGSWKDFFDTYWKLIYNTAIKAGLNDTEAQDVVQETVIEVSKRMPGFRYRAAGGSFKRWLLKLTAWRIGDQLRKKRRDPQPAPLPAADSTDESSVEEQMPDATVFELEAIWDEEWEKNLTDAAIQRVKRTVDPKQYQLFHLYVMKHWSAREVARSLRVNVGQVYLAKHRIGTMLKNEIQRLRTKPL